MIKFNEKIKILVSVIFLSVILLVVFNINANALTTVKAKTYKYNEFTYVIDKFDKSITITKYKIIV